MFFAIGFETTAPSTALTLKRAKAEGVTNFSCMCNHVTIVPPLRALLDSPDLRLDGFIGPGHVSTVVGARPFEFIPADYGKPIVVAGFEPLDVLQAVHQILLQLAEGRCEVENQYKRVVPYEGNPRALQVMSEVFELRPHFEWRGLGFISQSGLRISDAYADLDAELRWTGAGRARGRPEGVPVRRGAQGRDQAVRVQGVRHRLHARAPDRHLHGVERGRLRGLLQLRALRARAGGGVSYRATPSARRRCSAIIETARSKQAKFRDEQVTMSHGAGGKATQSMIEGLFVPAFGGETLAAMGDAGAVGEGMVMTTDSYVVKPLRFPGGSIGELAVNGTANDLAVTGAKPMALTLSMILEEGLPADDLRAEVEAIAAAAQEAGVEIVAGDTKVVERGHCDGMYLCTTGVGKLDPRAELSPAALRPGDRVLVSGTVGDHGTAIMLARGEFELGAEIESDTCSLWPAAEALIGGGRARPALHARRHARRRRLRAERAGPVLRCGDDREGGRRARSAGGGRRGGDPRHRPDVRGKRGKAGGVRGPGRRRRSAGRAAVACRAARTRPRSERSRPSRRGWSWWRPALAASESWTNWWGTPCHASAERLRGAAWRQPSSFQIRRPRRP